MKATLVRLAALAALAIPATAAHGQYPCIPQAPDACGPGYYNANCCGAVYGPNYDVYPCFPPYNGAVFGPASPPPGAPGYPGAAGYPGARPGYPGAPAYGPGAGLPPGMPAFPTHPFARSPRDFFMVYE